MTLFILILFFGSLMGIIFMIGRKLVLLKNGRVSPSAEITFEIPYLKEAKHLTLKNIKKHGYSGLVGTIRLYVKSSNFVKNKYREVKVKIIDLSKSRSKTSSADKQEISKFLKIISDYKHKIREIKHKIK